MNLKDRWAGLRCSVLLVSSVLIGPRLGGMNGVGWHGICLGIRAGVEGSWGNQSEVKRIADYRLDLTFYKRRTYSLARAEVGRFTKHRWMDWERKNEDILIMYLGATCSRLALLGFLA